MGALTQLKKLKLRVISYLSHNAGQTNIGYLNA